MSKHFIGSTGIQITTHTNFTCRRLVKIEFYENTKKNTIDLHTVNAHSLNRLTMVPIKSITPEEYNNRPVKNIEWAFNQCDLTVIRKTK